MPNFVQQVTIVGEGINKSLLEQAGVQAAVPTIARVQSPDDLSFAANNSVDAVVCLRSASNMSSRTAGSFLSESSRVLKPGCPLIFVEKGCFYIYLLILLLSNARPLPLIPKGTPACWNYSSNVKTSGSRSSTTRHWRAFVILIP